MTSKGAATSLIALSVLLFISSGNIFGALVIDNNVKHHLNYNRGDYALIAETKTKTDLFPKRIAAELNYSSDYAALTLAENDGDYSEGNDISWDNNVPSENELMENYYTLIRNRFSDENDEVLGCEDPDVTDISEAAGGSTTDLEAALSQDWIECTTEHSEVNISLPGSTVETNNVNNLYPGIATYASTVAGEARYKANQAAPVTGTGYDSGSSCPESRSREVSEAKSEARSNALSGLNSLAQDSLDSTSDSRPDGINSDSSTTFYGALTGRVTDSNSCKYNCPPPESSGSCSTGTIYDAEGNYVANRVEFDFNLADGERQVIDSTGEMETIEFDFTYKHSFN